MSLAIAGWRTSNGWTRSDAQQSLFRAFGLDSYAKGELNFGIKRSLLVQNTPDEQEDLLTKKATRAVTLAGIVDDVRQLPLPYSPQS